MGESLYLSLSFAMNLAPLIRIKCFRRPQVVKVRKIIITIFNKKNQVNLNPDYTDCYILFSHDTNELDLVWAIRGIQKT